MGDIYPGGFFGTMGQSNGGGGYAAGDNYGFSGSMFTAPPPPPPPPPPPAPAPYVPPPPAYTPPPPAPAPQATLQSIASAPKPAPAPAPQATLQSVASTPVAASAPSSLGLGGMGLPVPSPAPPPSLSSIANNGGEGGNFSGSMGLPPVVPPAPPAPAPATPSNLSPYMQSLLSSGQIKPFTAHPGFNSTTPNYYISNDGMTMYSDYGNQAWGQTGLAKANDWNIPLYTGTNFLNPNDGSVQSTGKLDNGGFLSNGGLALLAIGAMTGGAAMTGEGAAGAAAGSTTADAGAGGAVAAGDAGASSAASAAAGAGMDTGAAAGTSTLGTGLGGTSLTGGISSTVAGTGYGLGTGGALDAAGVGTAGYGSAVGLGAGNAALDAAAGSASGLGLNQIANGDTTPPPSTTTSDPSMTPTDTSGVPPNPNVSGVPPNPALSGAGSTGTSLTGNSTLDQILQRAGTGAVNNIVSGGGSNGSGNSNLTTLAQLANGAYGAYQQSQASQAMLNWLNGQQAKIDNLYQPGSPEYNALWNKMSAMDAAAGRNSQYGTRSVDLAAKIAQIKADATARLTQGIGGLRMNATALGAGAGSNLSSAISSGLTNGSLQSLINGLGGSSTDPNNVDYSNLGAGILYDSTAGSSSLTGGISPNVGASTAAQGYGFQMPTFGANTFDTGTTSYGGSGFSDVLNNYFGG